jgi:hypothetical protein
VIILNEFYCWSIYWGFFVYVFCFCVLQKKIQSWRCRSLKKVENHWGRWYTQNLSPNICKAIAWGLIGAFVKKLNFWLSVPPVVRITQARNHCLRHIGVTCNRKKNSNKRKPQLWKESTTKGKSWTILKALDPINYFILIFCFAVETVIIIIIIIMYISKP